MEKLWDIVLQASFYGTIVGVFILVTKKVLRKKLNGRFHYLIWMLLIIKLIVPVGPESNISIFNKIPAYNVYKYNAENTNEYYEQAGNKENTGIQESENNIVTGSYNNNIDISGNIESSIKDYLPFIWIIGTINIIAVMLFSQIFLCKKIRLNNRDNENSIEENLDRCKNKMAINRDIKVVVNDFVNTPSLFGVIKPKILIPSSMINLSDKELEYIFLHELAHYKRKDILFNYILLILQAIHWFNPAIWYLFKRIREDMELGTDEIVLKNLDDKEHKEYGKAILTVLEKIKSSKFTPGVLGIIEDKKTVKNRIEMIKNMKLNKNKKLVFTIFGMIAIILLGVILLTSQKESEEKDYIDELYSYKSQYIGDASNISNLVNKLPLSKYKDEGIELQTETEPYGLNMSYTIKGKNGDELVKLENDIYSNSAVLFSLISNLGYVQYEVEIGNDKIVLKHSREEISQRLNIDINSVGNDIESFRKFVIEKSLNNIGDLDYLISNALINSREISKDGEVATEGHVILEKEESENSLKVYLISSGGSFGFENGIFTIISGYGSIPMVMDFSKDKNGNLTHVNTELPMDGADNESSIKKMFPKHLHKAVLNDASKYKDAIERQQEAQAQIYLDSIGRNAKVQAEPVEKELADININASNTLIENEDLFAYPYWIGNREEIIDGVRYIYEQSHSRDAGYDVISYTKKDDNDNLIEQYKYRINGVNPELVQ